MELGALLKGYGVPERLVPLYEQYPFGVAGLLAMRLGREKP
jgi:hypothetical protein